MHLLTYSMEQSSSWEANWFAASQELSRVLWNPTVPHRTHKCPPPVPILSQPNPVFTPTSHFFKIHPQLDTPISQIYSWNKTLHVLGSSSVHHQECFTVHTAMVRVIQFCRQPSSRIRMEHPDPARKLSAKLYDIHHCCVYSEKLLMMDTRTVRNM
jgi:hypothetical protein